ncbi:hypothetical protein F0562_003460 [Nyssa sinensis]|uniref:Uncharacterized protein n=1 Tax=Nyssa sinensis TaxID=561372 RepID=A0A5J5C0P5_9ASTE|nr:hypothetical protein F0562_003460 [Nyssa sinensis]
MEKNFYVESLVVQQWSAMIVVNGSDLESVLTVMVDINTWNINHLATIGRAMSSYEDELCEIMKSLDVDWSMIAKASPYYVTYMKDSMDQIINCFESNVAVSQIITLETTAAVQMRIDEAKQTTP